MVLTETSDIEYRKVQGLYGDQSLLVVLPRKQAADAGIAKGSYVRCFREGKKIVIESAEGTR